MNYRIESGLDEREDNAGDNEEFELRTQHLNDDDFLFKIINDLENIFDLLWLDYEGKAIKYGRKVRVLRSFRVHMKDMLGR